MSIYTNDIDTLRQMISQSIPQIINSAITILRAIFPSTVIPIETLDISPQIEMKFLLYGTIERIQDPFTITYTMTATLI